MDKAFGTGNWSKITYADAMTNFDTLFAAPEFVYIDGGDGQTTNFDNFVNANRAGLQDFVSAGGSLFLNSATWGGINNFDLGFGATRKDGVGHNVTVIDSSLAAGPYTSVPTSYTGYGASHNYIIGGGITLMDDEYGRAILTEMNYGDGTVMLGGLTTSEFWSPTTAANDLKANIFAHGDGNVSSVPEPATMLLFGSGIIGLIGFRRKFKKS